MIRYRYVKKPKSTISDRERTKFTSLNPHLLAGLLVVLGIFFFINAAYPIVSYQILVSPRFSPAFISPSSESELAQSFGFAQGKVEAQETEVLGAEIDLVDYTKASNWFPSEKVTFTESESATYSLSIPKLEIKEAKVVVGLEDLKKSLVQYPGTALPGKFGNTIIFGHSVLPQFFNPKNYISIFSTLPTLRAGDEIFLNYNQVEYKYLVEQMIEVSPDDISILAQRHDDSYLSLVTCVPPGTFLRRLIVRGRLSKI